MKSAETCSCSLFNKLYAYLYHRVVVLDKYIHSNLVYVERLTEINKFEKRCILFAAL
jgi:hypothetical protein